MSESAEKFSPEAFRAKKGALTFDFLDSQRDEKLELGEFLEYAFQLMAFGRKKLAGTVTDLSVNYWKLMNEAIGRPDLQSFTKEEWVEAYKVVWNNEWYKKTFIFGLAQTVFESIDMNQDGLISFEEWTMYLKRRAITDQSKVKDTFDLMDRDKKGHITPADVKYAYTMFALTDDPTKALTDEPTKDYSFIYNRNL